MWIQILQVKSFPEYCWIKNAFQQLNYNTLPLKFYLHLHIFIIRPTNERMFVSLCKVGCFCRMKDKWWLLALLSDCRLLRHKYMVIWDHYPWKHNLGLPKHVNYGYKLGSHHSYRILETIIQRQNSKLTQQTKT